MLKFFFVFIMSGVIVMKVSCFWCCLRRFFFLVLIRLVMVWNLFNVLRFLDLFGCVWVFYFRKWLIGRLKNIWNWLFRIWSGWVWISFMYLRSIYGVGIVIGRFWMRVVWKCIILSLCIRILLVFIFWVIFVLLINLVFIFGWLC